MYVSLPIPSSTPQTCHCIHFLAAAGHAGMESTNSHQDTVVTSKRAVKGSLIHANACFVNVPADAMSSVNCTPV